ncbi:fibronectin-binding protein PlpA isoform X2 [Neocloeon triangulifer]|uniref:fibronectin-binding protein PlpA isoform X2 n=1 Tax=Neocloeon triangulifer TaxID=2078957 RepID=UPI00286ECDB5|nr:fibronectin-binding protein PlpA isoform X2 [Neocloeon triangulifer]
MEKADSMATVNIKEFPDNVSYTTEAPPAYKQPRAAAVQITKIIAVTVIVASAIIGGCILASAWIQSRATCELLMMEQQLQQAQQMMADNPSYQALVQDNAAEESKESSTTTERASEEQNNSQQLPANRPNRLPLQLDFDELAGALMDNNQRAHMNCVVEKRRSEELVDHAPREVSLPFGLNLTTPPRLEHLTGEKMVISCESGRAQERHMPPPPPPPQAASVPLMIPLPGGPIHLPMPFAQHINNQQNNDLGDSHPMEHIEMIVAHPMMDHPQPHHPRGQPQMREMRMAILPDEPIPQESMRPHYVQPRSVPSQPDFLKRTKRCACDCNC